MFGHEGGYSNAKTDSGGPTKYGVTHKTLAAHRGVPSVTAEQVKALTLEEATEIYVKGYWTQSGGDLLPAGLDYAAFDFGVNSGPARAVKVLQRLVGVVEDGNIGPATLAAVNRYPGGIRALVVDYCDARMKFLKSLTNPKTGFPVNGRGWTIRVTGKDPKGQYAPQKGVVGNALALVTAKEFDQAPAQADVKADPVPAGGDAKAVPPQPNAFLTPEVLGPVGGVLGGLPALLSVEGPVQYVFAAGIGIAILLGAYYAFRRIQRTAV
jgi:lysozyme family protein